MTQTVFSRIGASILALFMPSSVPGDRPEASPSPSRDDADGQRQPAYVRDEDLYRLWAMHGHW